MGVKDMKKFLLMFTMLACNLGLFAGELEDSDNNGYLEINNLDDLRVLAVNSEYWTKKIELTADIDASETKEGSLSSGFIPIANGNEFSGVFDGKGHLITNLYINSEVDYRGIFAKVKNGEVKNINIQNIEVIGGRRTGGLIGNLISGKVINCRIEQGKVEGLNNVGGMIGRADESSLITNCFYSGEVKGENTVGGLIGSLYMGAIFDSETEVKIEGQDICGGVIGLTSYSSVRRVASKSEVIVQEHIAGGIIGMHRGFLSNCISNSLIKTQEAGGGICGYFAQGLILNSISNSEITGDEKIAAIAGQRDTKRKTSIKGAFWNKELCDLTEPDFKGAKSSAELKDKSLYINSGWNFDFIWKAVEGDYPKIGIDFSYRPEYNINKNEIHIKSSSDLRWVSEFGLEGDANYVFDENIDLEESKNWNSGAGFIPLTTLGMPYENNIYGNEHTISNLHINMGSMLFVGLVGQVQKEGSIYDLEIKNAQIWGDYNIGALAGSFLGNRIYNCHTSGIVAGGDYVGGLTGITHGKLLFCSSEANVTAENQVAGGITGNTYSSVIYNCYSSGNVQSPKKAGGAFGAAKNSTLYYTYAASKVNSSGFHGGLIGYATVGEPNEIYNSYWDADYSEVTTSYGGIGLSTGELKNSEFLHSAGWNIDMIWDVKNGEYPKLNIAKYPTPIDTDNNGKKELNTIDDLKWLSEVSIDKSGNWELTSDIDAEETKNWNAGRGFFPIGSSILGYFTGNFYGNMHIISNLTIKTSVDNSASMFGMVHGENGTIQELILDSPVVEALTYSAVLANVIRNTSLTKCYMKNITASGRIVSGIAGSCIDSKINQCCAEIKELKSTMNSAGLFGIMTNCEIKNCYSIGGMEAYKAFGGIGIFAKNCKLENCYSAVEVKGSAEGDGIIPSVDSLSSTSLFWDKDIFALTESKVCIGSSSETMHQKSTYLDANWDFENIWAISPDKNKGYPYFKNDPVGIVENGQNNLDLITIYPNPVPRNTEFRIDGNFNDREFTVNIYNINGVLVQQINNAAIVRLNKNINSGIYLVVCESKGKVIGKQEIIVE
jgi:hypothetical protein